MNINTSILKYINKLNLNNSKKNINSYFIINYDPIFLKSIFTTNFSIEKNIPIMMCILSGIMYTSDDDSIDTDNHIKNWGIEDYSIHKIGEGLNDDPILYFGIFHINGNLIIAFKGTNNIQDDYSDIKINTITSKNIIPGKVHEGFYNILFGDDRYISVLNEVKRYPDTIPIFITGHSLGAALGSLLYVYIKNNHIGNDDLNLITFGCPRIGNSEFSKCISDSKRYVNGDDIVPHLPLTMICMYSQTSTEILLGTSSSLFWKWSISEHYISNYFKKLLTI